ncbi:unnamed protein product [Adineta ricciae]|uniref:NADPH:adrenodoxin oxidoreductase, mitochondrial n=1 Tax=Adineta ricciae TaxID=249248 RepID=A0A814T111_ADIRI|nr:unnamed protein product [Adineta ricciae]CAF1155172.1 unnamed protein product [Adineta ricciae]
MLTHVVRRSFTSCLIRRSLSTISSQSSSPPSPIRICVVGSGPAGFYLTQNLLKLRQSLPVTIDILEKAPVPFGLVRYGVAPDHPEVKNVIHTFTKIAEHEHVRFIGNIHIGNTVRLQELQQFYHIVILAYGSSVERTLNIPGETTLENVFSAKDFVGWYNGVPENAQLRPKLDGTDCAVIIGMGNVALDCARILLSPVDDLAKTDITDQALDILRQSRIRHVILVGRRGPMQVSFTIKELRELTKLNGVQSMLKKEDFQEIDQNMIDKLERPRKRLTELMLKTVRTNQTKDHAERFWYLKFWRRPRRINGKTMVESVDFEHTEPVDRQQFANENLFVKENGTIETVPCGLVIKSIGYYGVQIDPWLPFDKERGIILNQQNRIDDRPGFYCTGWIGRGARGVIVETTTESHTVAKRIMDDIEQGRLQNLHDAKSGGDGLISLAKSRQVRCISYDDWKKLDAHETKLGLSKGKPREKILNIDKMLELTSNSNS